jgi:hypothetical protein
LIKRLALIGAAALAFVAFVYVQVAGSAVVVDETGGVVSAVVTDGTREQPLVRLWNGYFYAIPDMEGSIEIRCSNGQRTRISYVTGYMNTKVRVFGDRPCAQIVEVI